ncbi:MAG: Sec-independent protein translocase subunit TatA/TatB [Candidatus Rokuibacteriota bacterium]
MFDIGLQEILVIGVIALLVFGPSKLPELGRMVGRAMREFRRASDEFRSTVETNLHINDPDKVNEPAEASAPPAPADPAPSLAEPLSLDASAASTAPEVTVEGEPRTEPFCAQRSSRLFHRRDCAWVTRIPEGDRVYFKQLADARDGGLATCPVCEPWEPA